ncbi:small subunit ribosomal protein S11e [Pancytospora epiphaga]|nr:small subunit ribosomal protein S11e [Pancytospora epiphaga]
MDKAQVIVKDKVFPKQKNVKMDPYATPEDIQSKRFYRDIGYGIKTPETAINATYIDHKCPFTGDVVVRGRLFKGKIHKMKADKTVVVIMNYLFYDKKYKRYARRNTKINSHLSPCFNGLVKVGDTVICGETRPLSKTKHSAVVSIERSIDDAGVKVFDFN